jgi:GNAT superfamily N-acetyltransferase
MSDYLVRLYDLPELQPAIARQREQGIDIRRCITPEKYVVIGWIRDNISVRYASECEAAFVHHPVSCFIATEGQNILGFACYDATYKCFFGPTEVLAPWQGKGIGKALLLMCLHDMAAQGYAYGIIGRADPEAVEFYQKVVGAMEIEGSSPGIYRGMLGD